MTNSPDGKREHRYVTLKVCELDSPPIRRELDAYRHLDTVTTSKSGALLIRELLDAFKVTGREGEHQCLVHEPLGMSMETLRLTCPGEKLPVNILKPFLIQLLLALDFLHTDAGIVHAGNFTNIFLHLKLNDLRSFSVQIMLILLSVSPSRYTDKKHPSKD